MEHHAGIEMLTLKTMFGAGWTILARLAGRLIDFVTVLVLARILTPADFGLVALAMTIVSVLDVVLEVPLMQGLVRLPSIDRAHLDTAFTLGLARGAVLGAIMAAVAVPFSWLYSDSRLAPMVILLATASLARGLYSPGMSTFYRNLSFRQAFIGDVTGKVCAAALSIVIVFAHGGYWAIVANAVSSSVVATLMSYVFAPYRPALSLSKLSSFSGLIGWFSAGQFVGALNWQLDRVLLGEYLSHATFGQYTMSADLAVLPTQSLIGPAMQPVMAAFSTISHDAVRLRAAFLKTARFTMLLAVPACVGIALSADLVVAIMLGPKWAEAAVFLRWTAIPVGLSAYFQPLYSLAVASDRFSIVFKLNLLDFVTRLCLMTPALLLFGVNGVIAARAVMSLWMFILSMRAVRSVLAISIRAQLANLWQVAVACIAMAIAIHLLRRWPDLSGISLVPEFAAVVAVGALVYVVVLYVLGVRLPALGKLQSE